jgi:aminobenzoyl-glutamate utilization protein B
MDAGGKLTNIVTVTSTNTTTVTDTHDIPVIQTAKLSVVKTSPTVSVTVAGQVVPYSYTVKNEGNVTVNGGDYEVLVNQSGARLLHENLVWLGPVTYTPAEDAFARELQKAAGVAAVGMDAAVRPLEGQEREGGSTDVGDVSWVVPTLHVSVATAPRDVPWHAWPVVAAGGMSIGHKGLVRASKTLAATMVDLFDDPAARAAVRAEFAEKTKGVVYKPYIPDGPPPIPREPGEAKP